MLGIEGCSKVTDKGIKNIFESLNLLEKLKELTLYLSGCKGFGDEALIQLANNLRTCLNLETILLELSRFRNITDTGMDYLGKSISKL